MLHPNVNHRYTIEKALAHPWLNETIMVTPQGPLTAQGDEIESLPRLAAATQEEMNDYFKENSYFKKKQEQ
jgi:hypothetical protein